MEAFTKPHDVEKGKSHDSTETDISTGHVINDNAVSEEVFTSGNSLYAKIQRIAGKLGVEQRGIERVPEKEKTDTSMSHAGTLWLSANMVVSSLAIGVLAIPVFGLGFRDSALVIVFINILGILPVCFFSTFGPRFGLRQIMLSRFYFGYHGTILIAVFNILACIGWSSVNAIVGAQLLHAVNPSIPGWAGIIIIAISTLFICIFGYRIIHVYERFAWIPCFIILLVVLGVFAHSGDFDGTTTTTTSSPSATTATKERAGEVLSFAAAVFGFATGWCSLAADYTVYMRADTRRTSVFLWTFAGLFFPLCFTELLGAAITTATVSDAGYGAAYESAGIGGLLARVLVPALGRFGEFCLVVLALSIVANNCPNSYSASLSLQAVTAKLASSPSSPSSSASVVTSSVTTTGTETKKQAHIHRVPRFVWVVVATAVYIAISIPGYDHFEAALENFMLLIGYWLAVYEGVALTEHVVFRHRSMAGYKPEDYDDPSRLPPGYAALAAFLLGVLGAVLGMAQTWYIGPIAKLCGGDFGGDVGFELAFSFAAVSYVPFRTWEKRSFGR